MFESSSCSRFGSIQVPRFANEDLGEISPDTPVTRFISIDQRGTRHCFTLRATTADAQTLKHVPGAFPAIACNDASEACPRYEVHDLREQRLADIHGNFSGLRTRKTSRKSAAPFKSKPNRNCLKARPCNDFSRNTFILTGRQFGHLLIDCE